MPLHAIFRSRSHEGSSGPQTLQEASSELTGLALADTSSPIPNRTWRNVIGYHNALSGDLESSSSSQEPPSYHTAISRLPLRQQDPARDTLPPYSCSVFAEDRLGMKEEYRDPFTPVAATEWRDVYVVLHGTQLFLHQVKTHGFFSKSNGVHASAGRLIKRFTLQHAEVGLASDVKKIEWVPRSNLTKALSASALEQLLQTEPHLFKAVRQYPLRLRLGPEQFLLKFPTHDHREEWLQTLCAAIDIAAPLEDRTEPNVHTLPRRQRNRQSDRTTTDAPANITSQSFIHEQARLLQHYYPNLGQTPNETSPDDRPPSPGNDGSEGQEATMNSPDPDREEIDPSFSQTLAGPPTAPSVEPSDERDATTSNTDIQASSRDTWGSVHQLRPVTALPSVPGKWSPNLYVDPAQERLYRRRCLPVLLTNSRRAAPFVIKDGSRYQIDYDEQDLKPYPPPPPAYSKRQPVAKSASAHSLVSMTKAPEINVVPPEDLPADVCSILLSSHSSSSSDSSMPASTTTRDRSWAERLKKRSKQSGRGDPSDSSPQTFTGSNQKLRQDRNGIPSKSRMQGEVRFGGLVDGLL